MYVPGFSAVCSPEPCRPPAGTFDGHFMLLILRMGVITQVTIVNVIGWVMIYYSCTCACVVFGYNISTQLALHAPCQLRPGRVISGNTLTKKTAIMCSARYVDLNLRVIEILVQWSPHVLKAQEETSGDSLTSQPCSHTPLWWNQSGD